MNKSSDFEQELLDLFDEYIHSDINRRQFLERALKFAVGGLTATAIFESLAPRYAETTQVEADDPRLKNETIEFDSLQWQRHNLWPVVTACSFR